MDMPFDKLPKFLAIAGLTLAIAGAGFTYTAYIAKAQEQLKLTDIYIRYDNLRLHRVASLFSSKDFPSPKCMAADADASCLKQIEKFVGILKQHNSQGDSFGLEEKIEVEAFQDKFSEQNKIFRLQMALGVVGMLLGAGLAGYGFKGWRDLENADKLAKETAGKFET